MDFGSFFKVFWLFIYDFLATQNECSRIRLQCNTTQHNATQCNEILGKHHNESPVTKGPLENELPCPTLEKTICRAEFLSHTL